MRSLLDTQSWLWMHLSPARFPERVRALLRSREHELFLSSASVWELGIKHALGKLRLPRAPEEYVPDRSARTGTKPLPIEHAHALRAAALPSHHRDPFDRMLIAQAQLEQLTIITADRQFSAYAVDVLLV